jgi:hypothetical protein
MKAGLVKTLGLPLMEYESYYRRTLWRSAAIASRKDTFDDSYYGKPGNSS